MAYKYNNNRYDIVIVGFIIIYINIKNKQIAYKKKKNSRTFDIQISKAVIATIAAIIALYATSESYKEEKLSVSAIETPII